MSLFEIQQKLKAPKSKFNKFGKYSYRSLEDILEAVKPILKTLEYTLVIEDEIKMIGDRYYVRALAKLFNKSGEVIASNYAFAREPENKKGADESQITGAASSYARKYALNGLFAIDDCQDADATNKHEDNAGFKNTEAEDKKQVFIDNLEKLTKVELIKDWWIKNKEGIKKELGDARAAEVYQHMLENIKILEAKDATTE
jgi:hypothetical protein